MALNKSSKIRLICFDLDGTLVDNTIYIWSTLHEYFGSDSIKREQAADDFRAGRISYRDWFLHDLELLKKRGATRARMLQALDQLTPTKGAPETIAELRLRGYKLSLISGSLDLVLDHFFPAAPFEHVLINRIHFDDRGAIKGGRHTEFDLAGKATGLIEIAGRENLSLAECAFVGDNVNDLDVMSCAGFSVGVNIKSDRVAQVVDFVSRDPDLRSILSYFPGPPA